jgi:NTP pyrophosphatase (non-canonical NTP hydrolase)
MKLKEYENIIAETAIYPKQVKDFGIAYCMLGLIEEFGEYLEHVRDLMLTDETAKLKKKEAGDVIWYITAMATELGSSLVEIDKSSQILFEAKTSVDYLLIQRRLNLSAGKVKKHYRDNVDNSEFLLNTLTLVYYFVFINEKKHFNEILKMNYEKLIKRRETNTLHGEGDNREDQ